MISAVVALMALAAQLRPGDTLEAVRFTGNRAFSSRSLATVVSVRPRKPSSENQLTSDVASLEKFYQDQGFFEVQVEKGTSPGKRRLVAEFRVTEGRRTRIGAVALAGNQAFRADRLLRLMSLKPGQFLTSGAVEAGAQAVKSFYLNSGYPFVEVTGAAERRDTLATLSISIAEGPLCHVGQVRVRGNQHVRAATILRAAEIRPGEVFCQRRLYDAQRRLYAARLFSRVMFYVIRPDSSRNEVAVRFDVVEQPFRGVAFGVGVETPPNRFLLSAEWEHNNVLNRGQQVVTGTEYSPALNGDYRVNVDATYRVPYLILTRIDFQTHPFYSFEKLDSVRQHEYGLETGMSRSVAPQLVVGLSNRLRVVSQKGTGITNSLALSGQYDTRNDIFDPSRGISAQAVAEVAGGPLKGDNDFYRLTADARLYQDVGFGFVVALRAMAGRMFPYGRTEAVPYYEAFTLGGRSSLRGYDDRSLGPDSGVTGHFGPVVFNGNVEVRTPYLLRWVGLAGFLDAGNVAREFDLSAAEYSVGAGIRVRTPIGPVRLDWGYRLRNPVPGDKGRLYLGLLHAF